MLNAFPLPESLGWWRSQVDYLSDKTKIWKFEDGLGRKFSKWFSGILGVKFQTDVFMYYPSNKREGVTQLRRTDKLIDNIKKIFSKDIEQLYPELI